jgi:hypothetical protein
MAIDSKKKNARKVYTIKENDNNNHPKNNYNHPHHSPTISASIPYHFPRLLQLKSKILLSNIMNSAPTIIHDPKPNFLLDLEKKKKFNWTVAEDQLLKYAIKRYGFHQWRKITTLFFGSKHPNDCRIRWFYWLDPTLKTTITWSKKEDQRLILFHNFSIDLLEKKTNTTAIQGEKNPNKKKNNQPRFFSFFSFFHGRGLLKRNPRQCFFRSMFLQKLIQTVLHRKKKKKWLEEKSYLRSLSFVSYFFPSSPQKNLLVEHCKNFSPSLGLLFFFLIIFIVLLPFFLSIFFFSSSPFFFSFFHFISFKQNVLMQNYFGNNFFFPMDKPQWTLSQQKPVIKKKKEDFRTTTFSFFSCGYWAPYLRLRLSNELGKKNFKKKKKKKKKSIINNNNNGTY